MTIQEAQKTVDKWINTIGIRYYNELTNTAILMEEVGEVARLMARLYGEQSFKTPEQAASARADLAEESGLLVPSDAGDGNRAAPQGAFAIHLARTPHLR